MEGRPQVGFKVLGPLEVRVGGQPADVGGPLPRALLAHLLLYENEPLRDGLLCEWLWDTGERETHKDKLHQHVSRLRAVLEPERRRGEAAQVLVSRAGTYRLVVRPDELDSLRFRHLTREGREAADVGDFQAAVSKLRAALALWTGEHVLPDLGEEHRGIRPLIELENERRAAVEARIEAELIGLNRFDVAELRTLFEADPTDERFCAHLMLALYRSDRAAAAVDVYWDACKALDAQGREPGEPLKRRHREIELRKPSLDFQAAPEVIAVTPPTSVGPARAETGRRIPRDLFVGREDALGEIHAALAEARDGHGCLVLVAGEPGIGKSRLARVCAQQAEVDGVEVLWGSAREDEGTPPNWPWIGVFSDWLGARDAGEVRRLLATDAPVLAQMVPDVAERLPGLATPAQLDEPATRFRLQNAVVRVLQRSAARRPILIVLDNLHNASPMSVELLGFLVEEIADEPILVIGTYRDTAADQGPALTELLGTLPRNPLTRRITLRGLREREVSSFFQLSLGVAPTARLTSSLHERTSGNPQFLNQVVRSLAEESPDLARLEQKLDEEVPDELRETVRWRLSRLSEDARYVMDVASVLGRDFDLTVLETIIGLDTEHLLELLEEGIALGFIDERPSGDLRYRFSHAVVRDALYRQLGGARRSLLHRRAGDALEEVHGGALRSHLAVLAHHYSQAPGASGRAKALHYLRQAGEQALDQLAYEDAVRHFTAGRKRAADPAARCDLLLALAEAQLKAGDPAGAQDTYREAAEVARTLRAPEQLATAALGVGNTASEFGAADGQLIRLLEEALAALGPQPSPLRAKVLGRLAVALYWVDPLWRGGYRRRQGPYSEEAVRIARAAGDPRVLAAVLDARSYALWSPDHLEERLALAAEIVEAATAGSDRQMVLQGRMWRFVNLVEVGDIDEADAELDAYALLAEVLRQPLQEFWPPAWRAMRALMQGRFADAEALNAEARGIGARTRDAAMLANTVASQLFFIRLEQRAHPELESDVQGLASRYPELPAWRLALALTHLLTGRRADARREYERFAADEFAAVRRDGLFLPTLALLTELCATFDDAPRAKWLYELLQPYADRVAVLGFAAVCMGSVSHYLGRLALLEGATDIARSHFTAAVAVNERIGDLPHLLRSKRDLARVLLAGGRDDDRTHALALREEVARTAAALGLPALAREAWALR